jgi:hypothetical protein
MAKTAIGSTYWYGWSVFIPAEWKAGDGNNAIMNQWATYPNIEGRNFREACGASGNYIDRSGDVIKFIFQRADGSAAPGDIECTTHKIADIGEVSGKWMDFVMHAKWTGNTDGFLKLWVQIDGKGYQPVTGLENYVGRTWWNDEGDGPYLKMGIYTGDPDFSGPAPRYFYTDEYRLGNSNASFSDVSPDNTAPGGQ